MAAVRGDIGGVTDVELDAKTDRVVGDVGSNGTSRGSSREVDDTSARAVGNTGDGRVLVISRDMS